MRDGFRVAANLIFAVGQAAVPALGYAGLLGQTNGAQFQVIKSPVVPATYAFSIWSLLFLLSLLYALEQARPSRRQDPLLRRIGWLTALVYAANTLWSVLAQLEFPLALTALTLTVGFLAVIGATLRLAAEGGPRGRDVFLVGVPVFGLAGWLTAAVFANWSVTLVDLGLAAVPSRQTQALLFLSAAGLVACATAFRAGGPLAYGATFAWALLAIVVANIYRENLPLVAAAGAVWLVLLALSVLAARRRAATAAMPERAA